MKREFVKRESTVRGAGVVLVLALALTGALAAGVEATPIPNPPPHAPGNAQQCFQQYLSNVSRCFDVCCWDLFWIWHISCDDPCLIDCQSKASDTYDTCVGGG